MWPMNSATQASTCTRCGSSVGSASIFCKDCGATLLPPAPLIPSPADVQPKRERKRILWKWSLVAAAILLAYFMWQCGSGMIAGARLSDDAVRRFHSQLDSGAYEELWKESDDSFQNSGSHEELLKFLAGVHSKLGVSRSSTRTNIFVSATTNGTFIKVTYESTFEKGNATETFTWRKTIGGSLILFGYNIQSKTFFSE